MDGIHELNTLADALRHPMPDPGTIRRSRIETAVWISAIEMLEGRLLFANAIHHNAWMEQPTDRRHQIDATRAPLNLNDIRQMAILLDSYLLKQASREHEQTLPFTLSKTIERLLTFKLALSSDPGYRFVFNAAIKGIASGERQALPAFSVLPTENNKARIWYKYYGMYSGLLNLVQFNGEAISRLKFNPDWLNEEDGILMMLICYALQSGRDEKTLDSLYKKAEKTAEALPSARILLGAIKALHLRSMTKQKT